MTPPVSSKLRPVAEDYKRNVNPPRAVPEGSFKVVGAKVAEAEYLELRAIQVQRGDRTLSDTARAAFALLRSAHWKQRDITL